MRGRRLRFGEKSQENPRSLDLLVLAFAKRISGVTRCPVMADLMKAPELKERLKKIPEWELEKKCLSFWRCKTIFGCYSLSRYG